MAIVKALNPAPVGIASGDELGAEPIEIEIEDPESVAIRAGGMEIVLEPEPETAEDFDANLAEYMSEDDLSELATELLADFQSDVDSRKDWMQTYVDGIQLLGMKLEDRTEPWPGACGVYHPLLSEALVKFQSETIMETFPAQGPVKTQIIGKEDSETRDAAARVKDDMNYQLTERMPEYRPEHERLLWGLGLAGNAFKKVYYDPSLGRQVAIFVPAEDIVVPYGASSLETSERVAHIMRKTENEMRKLQVSGFYRDIDLGDPTDTFDDVEKKIAERMGFRASSDDRFKILEMHVTRDLKGYEDKDEDGEETGIGLPYVITIEKHTAKVLAVRRNWNPDDELKMKRQHFVHYGYVPGFGFYCFGLIHLIGAYAKSGTSLIRQLVDAGTLSNLPGGFKTKGLRVKGDDTPIAPAEFRDVDVASGTIKDNIMTLPYKEPSQVLAALMDKIIEEGRRFASAADLKISDMSAQSPVGTTLAILERTLKIMSAVQARIHYSMKQEFKLLKTIIRDYTPEDYSYEPEEGDRRAKQSDYDRVDVIPVSDPNAATMSQKVVQYQAVMQLAQSAPQLYDMAQLHRQMLEVLGIKNAHKLVKLEEDSKPKDPITENMDVVRMKPLKAFAYQDQQAHIATHQAFMQDPMTAQMIGQNPLAQQMMAALQAHIAEHYAFMYRNLIEQQVGAPLPAPDSEEPMPEEFETALSRMVAQAAQQLLMQNQAAAQQKQAQQQAQDPILQMQMQELQIKAQEVQRKAQKDQTDAQLKTQQMQMEQERVASQERAAMAAVQAKQQVEMERIQSQEEIEGMKIGVQVQKDKEALASKEEIEGMRIGIDIARAAQQGKGKPK
jgi:virulence-associated protein VagC